MAGTMNDLEDIAAHVFRFDNMNDSSANEYFPEMKTCRTESVDNNESFFALTQDSVVMHALTSWSAPNSFRYNDVLLTNFFSIRDALAQAVEA